VCDILNTTIILMGGNFDGTLGIHEVIMEHGNGCWKSWEMLIYTSMSVRSAVLT